MVSTRTVGRPKTQSGMILKILCGGKRDAMQIGIENGGTWIVGATTLRRRCGRKGSARDAVRGAGAPPCYGNRRRHHKCVPAAGVVAIRAGQLFDSKSGQMADPSGRPALQASAITEVGPEAPESEDPGRRPGDRPQARRRFCPAMIDAHTAYVQQPQTGMSAGNLDPSSPSESAGRPVRRASRRRAT